MSKIYLNLKAGQRVLAIGVGILVLVGLFQNCGEIQMSSRSRHPLPFDSKKVVLTAKTLGSEAGSEIPADVTLSVLLNNRCARPLCEEEGSSESISCVLIKSAMMEDFKDSEQYYAHTVTEDVSLQDFEERIKEDPIDNACVVGVSEIYQYVHKAITDPFFTAKQKSYVDDLMFYQSGMSALSATALTRVRVAVIDTGVEDHGDLLVASREDVRQQSSIDDPACPGTYQDYYGHGTAVASVIGGVQNNSRGIAGLAPNADIYSFMIGRCRDSQSSTIEIGNAINRARAYNVDIINISYGGGSGDDIGLRQAVAEALNKNIVLVVAAGNNDKNISLAGNTFYPAHYAAVYPGVISVASTDNTSSLRKATFSNYGLDDVKIAAPGQGIFVAASSYCKFCSGIETDSLGYTFAAVSGTSFSAPIVTSAAAVAIGYLKAKNFSYDPAYVENIVTTLGTRNSSNLNTVVRGGTFLDFAKLATALKGLDTVTPNPSGISAGTSVNYAADGSPVLTLTVTLNLQSVHPGARIGVYDSTCSGTAVSCLIQDRPLTQLRGSYTFTFTRSDFAPMEPSGTDPNFPLNFMVAVHYPVPVLDRNNKPTGSFLNNHGLDASAVVNLRNMNASQPSSDLVGKVTNIRYDMQNFYVQGWACLKRNNATATVSVQDLNGIKVNTSFRYAYDLMYPHTFLDSRGYYNTRFTPPFALPTITKPYSATDQIKTVFSSLVPTQRAGLIGSGETVLQCETFSSAHGFEFVIPLKNLPSYRSPAGDFQVVAEISGRTAILKDESARAFFKFPDVHIQPTVANSFNVMRSSDYWSLSGSLCSASASPVEVEITATYGGFQASYYDNSGLLVANTGASPLNHDINGNSGHVYDPTVNYNVQPSLTEVFTFSYNLLQVTLEWGDPSILADVNDIVSTAVASQIDPTEAVYANDALLTKMLAAPLSARVAKRRINQLVDGSGNYDDWISEALIEAGTYTMNTKFAGAQPPSWTPPISSQIFLNPTRAEKIIAINNKIGEKIEDTIDALGLLQVKTGRALNYHSPLKLLNKTVPGQQYKADFERYVASRAGSDTIGSERHWDGYDVGDPVSSRYVSYKLDEEKPVGAYLKGAYTVSSIQREIKKYETPLSSSDLVLGHAQLDRSGSGCAANTYRHQMNSMTISNIPGYAPWIYNFSANFWVNSTAGSTPVLETSTAMRRLPVNLRFFQDGKLLLHLESDYSSNFRQVQYPFNLR